MSIFTIAFLKYALERSVKTVAQTALAGLTANQIGILAVNWQSIGSLAALAGVVSILTSVTSFTGPSGFLTGSPAAALVAPVLTAPVVTTEPVQVLAEVTAPVPAVGAIYN